MLSNGETEATPLRGGRGMVQESDHFMQGQVAFSRRYLVSTQAARYQGGVEVNIVLLCCVFTAEQNFGAGGQRVVLIVQIWHGSGAFLFPVLTSIGTNAVAK